MACRVLIVEDDRTLNDGIAYALAREKFGVFQAYRLSDIEKYIALGIDLMILDINLPDGDGREYLKRQRDHISIPVIFLTARDKEEDMLQGFDAGGDDYMAKPFSMPVLLKRIQALLKRGRLKNSVLYVNRDLSYDKEQRIWKKRGEELILTATEIQLLELFLANSNMVLTREMILERIWDIKGNYVEDKTLNVNISRLRDKIEDNPREPQYIRTVFGIGYKWSDEYER